VLQYWRQGLGRCPPLGRPPDTVVRQEQQIEAVTKTRLGQLTPGANISPRGRKGFPATGGAVLPGVCRWLLRGRVRCWLLRGRGLLRGRWLLRGRVRRRALVLLRGRWWRLPLRLGRRRGRGLRRRGRRAARPDARGCEKHGLPRRRGQWAGPGRGRRGVAPGWQQGWRRFWHGPWFQGYRWRSPRWREGWRRFWRGRRWRSPRWREWWRWLHQVPHVGVN